MNGGGTGGVYGEVIKKLLTIGKADKQGDSAQFGEVLLRLQQVFLCICRPILCKTFSVDVEHPPGILRRDVADGF